MREQLDLQVLLVMSGVYCMDAAGRTDPSQLLDAAEAFQGALAAAADLNGEGAAIAAVEAHDEFLRRAAELSGSEIIPKLVRNAIDRTHFPRALDGGRPSFGRRRRPRFGRAVVRNAWTQWSLG